MIHKSATRAAQTTFRNRYYRYHLTGNEKVTKNSNIKHKNNQVPHLTEDTNKKLLDTANESQEVSPLAGDHKAQINRRVQRQSKHKTKITQMIPPFSKNKLLEGLNRFHSITSPLFRCGLFCPLSYLWCLFWYKQADIIDAFNTTSRYLDDILNINNVYFDFELRLIKLFSDTK